MAKKKTDTICYKVTFQGRKLIRYAETAFMAKAAIFREFGIPMYLIDAEKYKPGDVIKFAGMDFERRMVSGILSGARWQIGYEKYLVECEADIEDLFALYNIKHQMFVSVTGYTKSFEGSIKYPLSAVNALLPMMNLELNKIHLIKVQHNG